MQIGRGFNQLFQVAEEYGTFSKLGKLIEKNANAKKWSYGATRCYTGKNHKFGIRKLPSQKLYAILLFIKFYMQKESCIQNS